MSPQALRAVTPRPAPERHTVVVTGVGGPAGRSAATFLRRRGHRVVGTDARPLEAGVDVFARVPLASEPKFVAALLSLVAREGASVLVPTVSEELPSVARLRGTLAAIGCALVGGPFEAVDVANDKLATARALGQAGVAVPKTFGPTARLGHIAAGLGLPLLVKPRVGRGGRGVRVLRSVPELLSLDHDDLVYQEFIPGEEFDVNLFVADGGQVGAAVVLRKTALRDGEVGNAAGVERVDHPEVAGVAIRAARALGLTGPLDVDVRLRADGTPVVLEVNARLGANVLSAVEVLDAMLNSWRNVR